MDDAEVAALEAELTKQGEVELDASDLALLDSLTHGGGSAAGGKGKRSAADAALEAELAQMMSKASISGSGAANPGRKSPAARAPAASGGGGGHAGMYGDDGSASAYGGGGGGGPGDYGGDEDKLDAAVGMAAGLHRSIAGAMDSALGGGGDSDDDDSDVDEETKAELAAIVSGKPSGGRTGPTGRASPAAAAAPAAATRTSGSPAAAGRPASAAPAATAAAPAAPAAPALPKETVDLIYQLNAQFEDTRKRIPALLVSRSSHAHAAAHSCPAVDRCRRWPLPASSSLRPRRAIYYLLSPVFHAAGC